MNVERSVVMNIKGNPKNFWKLVKSGIQALDNGRSVVEDLDKAEELNNFFASVFTKEDLSHIPTLPKMNVLNSLSEMTHRS